jgi:hypothetical protein
VFRRVHPKTLLFVLIGAVPVLVVAAGVASFLLLRAGYGPLVWGVAPFAVLVAIVGLLGLILGRAAGGPPPSSRGPDREDGPEGRP